MDKSDVDTFSRCTAEFRNSVICFGEILKIDTQKEAMKAANRDRQNRGLADAYGEEAFFQLDEQLDKILSRE